MEREVGYKDLREFISKLNDLGELYTVKEQVDYKYEIAAWTRYSFNMKPIGPALLFENIKSYGNGYRVFTAGLGSYSRMAISLNLDPNTSLAQIVRAFKKRIKNKIKPKIVSYGPVKENIHLGQEINLLEFPVPWWNMKDGGPYIGTWHGNVTKNPRSNTINVGVYRMQLYDKRHAGINFSAQSHIAQHYNLQERENKALEMAVVIGSDEALVIAGGSGLPEEIDEYSIASGLNQKPLELVKCETVDLEVPANAEIVLEGKLLPKERKREGPYGEYLGFYGPATMCPIFEVTGITHRNNPIFRGTLSGRPITEEHILLSILARAGVLDLKSSFINSKIKNLIFKYKIYPYIYRILPYLKALKGDRPNLCLPNKEILNAVSSKWQNSKKIDSST